MYFLKKQELFMKRVQTSILFLSLLKLFYNYLRPKF